MQNLEEATLLLNMSGLGMKRQRPEPEEAGHDRACNARGCRKDVRTQAFCANKWLTSDGTKM